MDADSFGKSAPLRVLMLTPVLLGVYLNGTHEPQQKRIHFISCGRLV